jgi:hypothetical protein
LVRNDGIPPVFEIIDPSTWILEIAGESCEKPTTFTLDVLNLEYAVNFQETYSKGNFDLWIAVHLPDSEFQFMIGTATQPVFNTEPQAFLAHVGCISEASYTTFGIR